MIHAVPPVAFALLRLAPLSAQAQMPALCPLTGDQANCVRVLACIGNGDSWFHGRALGRGQGTLHGQISDGTRCHGHWTQRNALGLGQAGLNCDDGRRATVLFTYQDEWTGTTTGIGSFDDGRPVTAWSGRNVLNYLDRVTGRPNRLPCPSGQVPIS